MEPPASHPPLHANGECPGCGGRIPADAPEGHCPRCLVRISFEAGLDRTLEADDPREWGFRRLGDYELLGEMARGGMGVVYRARQRSLDRIVAVKVLIAGEFAAPEYVQRFRREAEAAARLSHPNIVAVHAFGEWEGQHFLVMEAIEGRSLADLVRDHPLPPRRAAIYVAKIARAVAFAHAHGILHRDLKPSNVLIDSRTDEPRITDFGLAKRWGEGSPTAGDPEGAEATRTGLALGSPAYMAPEQVSGRGPVGPASDVHGLGALLYHLITGRPPFQSDRVVETLRQVLEVEPVAPRRWNAGVPVDLQTLCLKCLEKDPQRRYGSATDLAEELERFLSDLPIRARPISMAMRVVRFSRRRPAIAGLGLVSLALLAVVLIGSVVATVRIAAARRAEEAERRRFETANRELLRTVSVLELRHAEEAFRARDPAMGVAHLTALLRREPANRIAAERLVSALIHQPWMTKVAPPTRHPALVRRVAFRPDGRQVLSVTRGATAHLLDAVTGRMVHTLDHEGPVTTGGYSPDGQRVVTGSMDGTARLWNVDDGRPTMSPLRHGRPVRWAEFSPDGETVLTACEDGLARRWNAGNGELRGVLGKPGAALVRAQFSPDGNRVMTATVDGEIAGWSVESGACLGRREGRPGGVHAVAFSPEGRWLAAAFDGGVAEVWEVAGDWSATRVLRHAPWAPVWSLAFRPDGAAVLTTAEDGSARVWNVADGFPLGEPMLHEGGVVHGVFSPDGSRVVTSSADVSARLWDWRLGRPIGQPLRHSEPVRWAAFRADGKALVTASDDATTQIWRIDEGSAMPRVLGGAGETTAMAVGEGSGSVLATTREGRARVWEVPGGKAVGEPLGHATAVLNGDLSRDGGRAVTGCEDGSVWFWNLATGHSVPGEIRHAGTVVQVRFSAEADRAVSASRDGTARIWDAVTGAAQPAVLRHSGPLTMVGWDAAGTRVVTASEDGTAQVWDVNSGQPVTGPLRHRDHVRWAEFSPDSRWLVTASSDNTACLWEVTSGRRLGSPLQHARIVERASFTPDGRRVITVSQDRTARVWDAATGQAISAPMLHLSAASRLAVDPDGRRMLTAGWNSLARVWDVETGLALSEWLPSGGMPQEIGFVDSGRALAMGTDRGGVRIWEWPQAPVPVPEWFLSFAEGLAGVRVTDRGSVEPAAMPGFEAVQGGPGMARQGDGDGDGGGGYYERIADWRWADPDLRSHEPSLATER